MFNLTLGSESILFLCFFLQFTNPFFNPAAAPSGGPVERTQRLRFPGKRDTSNAILPAGARPPGRAKAVVSNQRSPVGGEAGSRTVLIVEEREICFSISGHRRCRKLSNLLLSFFQPDSGSINPLVSVHARLVAGEKRDCRGSRWCRSWR